MMAWFDTVTNAPVVTIDKSKVIKWVRGTGTVISTEALYWRTTTEARGLTLTAAQAYATATANYYNGQTVDVRRANEAGGYNVVVVNDTQIDTTA